ncbi:riboflavin biosynthesis protein RibF [Silvibacterium dinghuense]|uniref:Riboflavin biosynthesis protein n=1 Tax=Silvibacterium dinghuense TaxID=1560006 RepID=A0A4Q1SBI4_9BACT|nr:riboflavin biosynthesis protein RibF [Silvibacterium dinghuense]RXS94353.1 riboflavin biosynthesis protein RibF [Silvibacterium dinghuense]GGH16709.1 riboflavin biosynthesis protein [Silvibacterium dinghuense]
MQVFRSLEEIPAGFGPTVVAVGNFDGVHRGHRAIIASVRERAQALGAKSVALTFDPHPVRLLRPGQSPKLITPLDVRLELLASTGLDATVVIPFTPEFSLLTAQDFASGVLAGLLEAVEVHEGDNFRFGHNASAGILELRELGQSLGFAVVTHSAIHVGRLIVSSSEIRRRVAAGDVSTARRLLGRPFSIHSTQARGRGIGSRLTVPTINLAPYHELLPADGVYVTRLHIGGQGVFDGVTNAGVRPTFGEPSYAIETYLLDFDPNRDEIALTAETPLELCFLKRLRGERKFETPEALKAQILRDVGQAQRFFALSRQF